MAIDGEDFIRGVTSKNESEYDKDARGKVGSD